MSAAGGVSPAVPVEPRGFRWQYEAALEKSDLSPMCCWVLNRVAARADARSGMTRARFVPSIPAIMAATHIKSENTIRRCLQEGEMAGFLVIERRPGRKSGLALAIPGAPGIAEAELADTPADIPPVGNLPVAPSNSAPAPSNSAGVTPSNSAPGSDLAVQTTKAQTSLSDMLRAALPSTGEREIEYAVTTIQTQKAQGLIRNERAYLRTLIANGDAASFVTENSWAGYRPSPADKACVNAQALKQQLRDQAAREHPRDMIPGVVLAPDPALVAADPHKHAAHARELLNRAQHQDSQAA